MKNAIYERLNTSVNSTKIGMLGDNTAILATTIGEVRKENEDRAVFARINSLCSDTVISCYLLSDGMGGMQDGSQASSMTISVFLSSLKKYIDEGKSIKESAKLSIFEANNDVYYALRGKGGATLSLVIVDNLQNILFANIGDSRIYAISADMDFSLITKDDDIKNLLNDIDNVPLNKELSKRNGLTKFIGMGEDIDIEIKEMPENDSILLSSDGLHGIGDKLLSELYKNALSEYFFIQRSISLANWLGGHDNATAILIMPQNFKADFFNLDASDDYIGIWDFRGSYKFISKTVYVEKEKSNKKSKKIEEVNKSKSDKQDDKKTSEDTDEVIQFTIETDNDKQGKVE